MTNKCKNIYNFFVSLRAVVYLLNKNGGKKGCLKDETFSIIKELYTEYGKNSQQDWRNRIKKLNAFEELVIK